MMLLWTKPEPPSPGRRQPMADIQKVLREMRELIFDCDPDDIERWTDAIEAAMREPVAFQFGPELDWIANHWPPQNPGKGRIRPLFTFPPDAARLKEEGDAWGRELVVRNRELTEAQAEIERLQKALQQYAAPENWGYYDESGCDKGHGRYTDACFIGPEVARAALAGKEDV